MIFRILSHALPIALGFFLCSVSPSFANSGGAIDPNSNYTGVYKGLGQGDANAASVTIDSALSTSAYGGYSENGSSTGNKVTVSGSANVTDDVTGGSAQTGNAVNNSIVMSGGTVQGYLYGGSSIDGFATGNSVSVTGGTVDNRIYAGYSENSIVSGNTLTVTSGTMNNRIYGGYQYENGSATGNSVFISGGNMQDSVYGSYISLGGGSATKSVVNIDNGDIQDSVYGGRSAKGNALDNSISISGGTVAGDLNGGLVNADMGLASGNSVILSGNANVGGDVTGGSAQDGNAVNNSVVMSGGTVQGYLYGGSSIDGFATGNSVSIHGGIVEDRTYAGYSTNGLVSGNTLTVTGGTLLERIYGGYQYENGNATGNRVIISGGHMADNVYGGYFSQGNGSATGNSVTISGTPTFGTSAIIYGGNTNTGSGDVRTGNTLIVGTKGLSAGNIENFQDYKFVLFSGGGTGLTLGDIGGTDMGSIASSGSFTLTGVLPGAPLQPGNSILLLRNASGLTNVPTLGVGQLRQNSVLVLDYSLRSTGTDILADINDVQVAPENKALSEGRAVSLGVANLGGDLVAGAGMNAVRKGMLSSPANKDVEGATYGLVPFFAVSGSSMRYNTGSHVDINGMALITGLAKKWKSPVVDILAGAFFETAYGRFDTHNNINSTNSVHGKGNTHTVGGGILTRIDLMDTVFKGLYAEASLRAGSLTSDYESDDLRDNISGNTASYNLNSTYYGAHAGLGYIFAITNRASMDIYGKYFWTHQEGQSATILGNKFNFEAMDSQRMRLGGRFDYEVLENLRPYLGAAWEHEFDGTARATTYGYDVPAPSLKGSSGMGEVGLTWNPLSAQEFSLDCGIQGYLGQREGVSGNLQLRYEF